MQPGPLEKKVKVMRINFGIEIPNTLSWAELRAAALACDAGLWRAVYTFDHLMPCTAEELPLTVSSTQECESGPILEGWTLLAGLASLTERVRLGSMVSAVTMRHPALLAKEAITVDHISAGRVDLGLGVGWHEHEHAAFGIALGTTRQRCDRLDEGAEVLQALLRGQQSYSFAGHYFQLHEVPFAPGPVQRPLPLLIAGGGEKRTLRTVARWANASNIYGNVFGSFEEVRHKQEVLDRYCEEAGRDPREVRRTVTLYGDIIDDPVAARQARFFLGQHLYDSEAEALPLGEPQRLIDAAASFFELGIDEIVLNGPLPTPEKLARLNDCVLAAFA